MTAFQNIELPTPILRGAPERHEDGTPCGSHCDCFGGEATALSELLARQALVAALGMVRRDWHGVDLAQAKVDADTARDEAEERHFASLGAGAEQELGHEVMVKEETIEILAGMVARLMTEKS